jgi:hypothetical protein
MTRAPIPFVIRGLPARSTATLAREYCVGGAAPPNTVVITPSTPTVRMRWLWLSTMKSFHGYPLRRTWHGQRE